MQRVKDIWSAWAELWRTILGRPDADSDEADEDKAEQAEEKPGDEKKPDKKPKPAEKAKPKAAGSAADPWRQAKRKLTDTTTWIVSAFAAVLVAAVGTSPFLVFDDIDAPVEAAWATWGLVLAGSSVLAMIWATSESREPDTSALSDLLPFDEQKLEDTDTERMEPVAAEQRETIDRARSALADLTPSTSTNTTSATQNQSGRLLFRQPKDVPEHIEWILELRAKIGALRAELIDAHAANKTAEEIAAIQAQIDIVRGVLRGAGRRARSWQGRLLYFRAKDKFENIRPVLVVGGFFAAVGLTVFLSSSNFVDGDAAESTPAASTVSSLLLDDDTLVEAILAEAPDGCDVAQPLRVTLASGTGTDTDPWVVTSEGGPCGEFQLTVTSEQAAVVSFTATETTAVVGVRDPAIREAIDALGGSCDPDELAVSLEDGVGTAADPWQLTTLGTDCPLTQLQLTADQATLFGAEAIPLEKAPAPTGWEGRFERLGETSVLAQMAGRGFVVAALAIAALMAAAVFTNRWLAVISLVIFVGGVGFVLMTATG